jgi:hypothetical protein
MRKRNIYPVARLGEVMKVKNSQEAVEAMKKTAPGAIDAADVAEGAPNAGTRSAGKPNSGEPFKYAFSTATTVRDAKEDMGAHKRALELQEGQNLSKLNLDTPPGGDKEEPGADETFEKRRI